MLQQPQVGHGAPVLYGAPVNFGSTMSVTGVNMNRNGIPDVLQQSQASVFARWFKNLQECPRVLESRLAIVYTDFFLFPCFYMLSFALSDVYRELMWPWWGERNFSSPTRSSSSSELGPQTGVCLELDVKLSAAMVILAVACCQQVIWVNPQPRFRCRLVWGSSVHHYIDGRNVFDLHNNNLVNRSIKL